MAKIDNEDHPIRKLPITDPEARDEGPRLIPLPERRKALRPLVDGARYVDLADKVIGERRRRPRTQR